MTEIDPPGYLDDKIDVFALNNSGDNRLLKYNFLCLDPNKLDVFKSMEVYHHFEIEAIRCNETFPSKREAPCNLNKTEYREWITE